MGSRALGHGYVESLAYEHFDETDGKGVLRKFMKEHGFTEV
jgi:hypothetical protein